MMYRISSKVTFASCMLALVRASEITRAFQATTHKFNVTVIGDFNDAQALDNFPAKFVQDLNNQTFHDPDRYHLIHMALILDKQELLMDEVRDDFGSRRRRRRRLGWSRHLTGSTAPNTSTSTTDADADADADAATRTGLVTLIGTCFDCDNALLPNLQEVLHSLGTHRDVFRIMSLEPVFLNALRMAMFDRVSGSICASNFLDRVDRGNAKLDALDAAIAETRRSLSVADLELRLTDPFDTLAVQELRVLMDGLSAQLDAHLLQRNDLVVLLQKRRVQLRKATRSVRNAGLRASREGGADPNLFGLLQDAESVAVDLNRVKNAQENAI